jgi:putative GTP pyrophosphokinase
VNQVRRSAVRVPKDFASEYSRIVAPLPKFGASLETLMAELLKSEGINFHRVDHRIKSPESAADKVARKVGEDGEPRTLESFTDLLGLRVITYFQDEVDAVAQLLARQFLVDEQNSVNKTETLDPDRFGYASVHYVAQLSESRAALPEYHPFADIKFEVQIRSILQHAWAEIEHDLGYKAEAVPRAVKRRFSRLAGVLELADDEFADLRREVSKHQETTREIIENGALGIEIDQDSLSAFVLQYTEIGRLDNAIARAMSGAVLKRLDDEFIGVQAAQLTELGFASLEELGNYLDREWDVLKKFIHDRLSRIQHTPRSMRTPVPTGITLYYVGMLRHIQRVLKGEPGASAYSDISVESLRHSLEYATAGSDPLPGV